MAKKTTIERQLDLIANAKGFDKTQLAVSALGSQVGNLAKNFTGLITAFSSTKLGIKSVVEYNHQLNKSIIGVTFQFKKYGQGVYDVDKRMESFAKKSKMLRGEVISLMGAIESSSYVLQDNLEQVMSYLKSAVGNDVQAQQALYQSISSAFPDDPFFEKLFKAQAKAIGEDDSGKVEEINNALKDRLKILSLIAPQRRSEIKTIENMLSVEKNLSSENEKRRSQFEQQIDAYRQLERVGEDLVRALNDDMIPVLNKIGKMSEFISDNARAFGLTLLGIMGTLTAISTVTQAMSSLSLTKSSIGALSGQAKGIKERYRDMRTSGGVLKAAKGTAGSLGGKLVSSIGMIATKIGPLAITLSLLYGAFKSIETFMSMRSDRKAVEEMGPNSAINRNFEIASDGYFEKDISEMLSKKTMLEHELTKKNMSRNTMLGFKLGKSDEQIKIEKELQSLRDSLQQRLKDTRGLEGPGEEPSKRQQYENIVMSENPLNKQLDSISEIALKMEILESRLKAINELNSATGAQYKSQISFLQLKTSLSDKELETVDQIKNTAMSRIDLETEALNQKISMQKELMNELISSGKIAEMGEEGDKRVRELQAQISQSISKQLDLRKQKVQVLLDETRLYEGLEKTQASLTSKLQTQLDLADNLSMGVAATASMRMEVVSSLGKEIELQKQNLKITQENIQEAMNSGEDQDAINELLQRRNEIEQSILSKQQSQAQLLKVLRDGYVQAINAMTTGSGVFAKIVVDQNRFVGNLMNTIGGAPTSIRSGSATGGYRESERFGVGGINSNKERSKPAYKTDVGLPDYMPRNLAEAARASSSMIEKRLDGASATMSSAANQVYDVSRMMSNIPESATSAFESFEIGAKKYFEKLDKSYSPKPGGPMNTGSTMDLNRVRDMLTKQIVETMAEAFKQAGPKIINEISKTFV